jgi:hypothetical protein
VGNCKIRAPPLETPPLWGHLLFDSWYINP